MDERDVDPVPRVPRVRREPSGANHTRSVARNAARSSTRGLARNSVSLAVQADRVLPEPLHHRISEHLS